MVEFMSEFAQYLVAAGISSSRFEEIVRLAFYKAASLNARFSNSRINQSAVAAMTGLTRVQVRKFSKQKVAGDNAKSNRLEKIIEGWTLDPAFTTSNFLPKRLSVGHRNSSFNALVRKYGGDVPAKSVLRELIRVGFVTVKNQVVSLNSRALRTADQQSLQFLTKSLSKLLKGSGMNSNERRLLRTMNGEVQYKISSPKGRILMQRRIEKSMDTLMAELKTAGTAASIELPPDPTQAAWITRARVVLITEELKPIKNSQRITSAGERQ